MRASLCFAHTLCLVFVSLVGHCFSIDFKWQRESEREIKRLCTCNASMYSGIWNFSDEFSFLHFVLLLPLVVVVVGWTSIRMKHILISAMLKRWENWADFTFWSDVSMQTSHFYCLKMDFANLKRHLIIVTHLIALFTTRTICLAIKRIRLRILVSVQHNNDDDFVLTLWHNDTHAASH